MLFFFQLIFACFSCASSHPTKLRSFIKLVIIKVHGWNFQSYSCGDNFFLDDNTSLNFRVDDSKDGCLKKNCWTIIGYLQTVKFVMMWPRYPNNWLGFLSYCFLVLCGCIFFSAFPRFRRNQEIVWILNVLASDVHYQNKVLPVLERTFCLRRRNLLSESIFWF